MLRMWLGDLDQNSLSVLLGADFVVAGDWMFLALSAMGNIHPHSVGYLMANIEAQLHRGSKVVEPCCPCFCHATPSKRRLTYGSSVSSCPWG